MQYLTLCLPMIQDRPALYDPWRKNGTLLAELQRLAVQLRTSHREWKEHLAAASPGSSDSQITSEALEYALKELEDSLPPASPQDGDEPLSLDAAMAFLRRHPTPPA